MKTEKITLKKPKKDFQRAREGECSTGKGRISFRGIDFWWKGQENPQWNRRGRIQEACFKVGRSVRCNGGRLKTRVFIPTYTGNQCQLPDLVREKKAPGRQRGRPIQRVLAQNSKSRLPRRALPRDQGGREKTVQRRPKRASRDVIGEPEKLAQPNNLSTFCVEKGVVTCPFVSTG